MADLHRLFVYGTLMSPRQLSAVTGRAFPTRPAMLPDFVRIIPPGGYPYVVPQAGSAVEGLLLEELDATALAALDAYEDEGRLYTRRSVRVEVDGATVACEVYVGTGAASHSA
jgi:gamma-glutamylcyclotransferase (GGCT)/AIG2-like uncharacterized protein YtfP